jgi:uncharacterized protein (DUF2141 family)
MNAMRVLITTTILILVLTPYAYSADLTIKVAGIKSAQGMVGYTLYSSADGFPMVGGKGIQQWVKADPDGVIFSYKGLVNGTYAAAISHDPNGNQITDTNLLGLPTEDWGDK